MIGRGEIACERACRHGELLDAPFDEIAGRRRLGENDEVGLGIELCGLRDDAADPGDVLRVFTLGGTELR